MADSNNYTYGQVNIPGYEVCYFRNICNLLIPYPEDDLDYIPIHKGNYYIPQTDIIIYTTLRGENNLCPIPYKVDPINNKIVIDEKYKKHKLYYGSKNQFIYKHITHYDYETQEIPLPYEFRTGYNENNYFVFLNGRLLNKAFYRIIIPNMETNKIRDKVIYFTNIIKDKDSLDIFYISNSDFTRINSTGDLVVKAFNVTATEPIQRDFKVPLPYKDYPIDVEGYTSFLLFKHSLQINTDKYKIFEDNNEYYVQLLDVDEYLNYGDDLTFIFPYYKSDEETEDNLTKTNALKFITIYAIQDADSKVVNFSSIYKIKDKNSIYVFKNSELVSKENYTITGDHQITFNEVIPSNTQISIVIESDKNDIDENSIFIDYFNIPIMNDGQWSINLPKIDSPKSYIFFRKSKIIPKSEYQISDGKMILGRNYNNLKAGEVITAIFSSDGSDSINSVNFYDYNSTIDKKNTAVIDNEIGIQYTKENTIVFVNDTFVPNNYYTIAGNSFVFNSEKIVEDDKVVVYLMYKTVNQSRISTDLTLKSPNYVRFIERTIKSTLDNQRTFDIPWIGKQVGNPKKDIPFLVFIRGIFIPETQYTIIDDKIQFNDSSYVSIRKYDEINFEFCYANELNTISKKEYSASFSVESKSSKRVYYTFNEDPLDHIDLTVKTTLDDKSSTIYNVVKNTADKNVLNGIRQVGTDSLETFNLKDTWYTAAGDTSTVMNQDDTDKIISKEMQLPIVYSEPIDLGDRTLVFYSGTYVDPRRYTIDRYNRVIIFDEIFEATAKTKQVNIVCLYSGNSKTGTIGYIPRSGYLQFDESKLDRNINKNLMMIFVNGLLTPKSEIYDLSNSLKKITRNIKSRYDLNIIRFSPLITEFKKLYNPKEGLKYNIVINQMPNQRITVTCEDKSYNTSFIALENSTFTVSVTPDKGYKAGTIKINGENKNTGVLTKETTVTVTNATKLEMGKVIINNSIDNQIISVTCNGEIHTESFTDTVGSAFSTKVYCSREGYTPGKPNITSGKITKKDISISATAPTVNKIPFVILDKNLKNQSIYVTIKNNDKILNPRKKAPVKYTDIPYGSKFLLEIIPNTGYTTDNHIGPFVGNKWYTVDYMYPLDNLTPTGVTKSEKKTIKVTPTENETITVYTWNTYDTKKKVYVSNGNSITINVYKGDFYEVEVKANIYGFIPGKLIISNGLPMGTIEDNLTITAEPLISELATMVITRNDNVSEYYTIKVITGDGYAPLSEGIYKLESGISYYAQVYLHDEIVYTSIDSIVQNGVNTVTLLADGTVNVEEDENG